MKESKRAIRRFHRRRILRKRKQYWGMTWKESSAMISKKVINTPTPCSCFMCGNPRKHFNEKKREELKWTEKMKQELRHS